jgi:regulator of nucleoside diphosphate kinase
MAKNTIFLTQYDVQRLEEIILNPGLLAHAQPENLIVLRDELSRANVVAPEDIPADVVTMNSTVHIVDMKTREEEIYTLVYPSEADINESKISVLAPIGTAMLGCKAGDVFTWSVPQGERKLRIKKVIYQPEASGDYHL